MNEFPDDAYSSQPDNAYSSAASSSATTPAQSSSFEPPDQSYATSESASPPPEEMVCKADDTPLNASEDPVGSSAAVCPYDEEPKVNKKCKFDLIEVLKTGTDHKEILQIDPNKTKKKSHLYEVVSGRLNGSHYSQIEMKVNGITVEECFSHPENVINIYDPGHTVYNQDSRNVIKMGYEVTSISQLLGWKPITRKILVQTCAKGNYRLKIKSYHDFQFNLTFKGTLKIDHEGELSFGFTGKAEFNADNKNNKGILQIDYFKPLANKKSDLSSSLTFHAYIAHGSFKLGFKDSGTLKDLIKSPVKTVKDFFKFFENLLSIFSAVYKGLKVTVRVLKRLTGKNKKKVLSHKASSTHHWDFSKNISFNCKNKYMEDPDSFRVGRYFEWSVSGVIFAASWKWEFSDKLFSLIPWVGRIVAYLNRKLKNRDLAGISLWVGCSGKVEIKNAYNSKKLYIENKKPKKLNHPKTNLDCTLNFELNIEGFIRISAKTKYVAKGGVKAGVVASIRDGNTMIYNRQLVIYAVLYKETAASEVCTVPPSDDKLPDKCKPKKDTKFQGYCTIFKAKEIFNF